MISFILFSDFGIFKKPEVNESWLTYEFPPKPTLLGVLGAICGLKGYTGKPGVPEFYDKLKGLKVGLQPLELVDKNPPYCPNSFRVLTKPSQKMFVEYNNYHGYGSYEKGGNLIVKEQLLVNPAFRIFLSGEKEGRATDWYSKIKDRLKQNETVYSPYMGKNEFPLSVIFEGEQAGSTEDIEQRKGLKISTVFFTEIAKGIFEGPPPSEKFYRIYLNYPYKMENSQYRYKNALFSNSFFNIDWEKVKELGAQLINIGDENVFVF